MAEKKPRKVRGALVSPEKPTLNDFLKSRIFGQDEAIDALCNYIAVQVSGYRNQNRPLGIILLAGPSGVGKTETVELIAEYLFGKRTRLVKVECGLLKAGYAESVMVGSPGGLVGYNDEPLFSQLNLDMGALEQYFESGKYFEKQVELLSESILAIIAERLKIEAEIDVLKKLLNVKIQAKKDLQKDFEKISAEIKNDEDLKLLKDFSQKMDGPIKMAERNLKRSERKAKRHFKETNSLLKLFQKNLRSAQEKLEESSKERLDYLQELLAMFEANEARFPYSRDDFHSVILIDEIEEISLDSLGPLIHALDKATLKLRNPKWNVPRGAPTDFRNALIFLTSNLGYEKIVRVLDPSRTIGLHPKESQISIQKSLMEIDRSLEEGKLSEQVKGISLAAIKKHFPIKFVSRLERIVVFQPIGYKSMLSILEAILKIYNQTGPLELCFTEQVKNLIIYKAITESREEGVRFLEGKLKELVLEKLANSDFLDDGDPNKLLVADVKEGEEIFFYQK